MMKINRCLDLVDSRLGRTDSLIDDVTGLDERLRTVRENLFKVVKKFDWLKEEREELEIFDRERVIWNKFIDDNDDKDLFVCWKNKNVRPLFGAFKQFVRFGKTLVVICPKFKDYDQDLRSMISTSPMNVRIYEVCRMAMNTVLRAKARHFVRQFDNAITIPESLFAVNS